MNEKWQMSRLTAGILIILAFAITGCATNNHTPNPLRAIRPATDLSALGSLSDAGIVLYSTEALDAFEQSDTTNTILALAGGGTMGALGTAAVAAPGAAKGLLLGANAILMALNLWRPVERASADNQGSGLIREALGNYVLALVADGYCTVPSNRVSTPGAMLFATVNAAIKVVNDLRQGILDLGSQSVKQLQVSRAQEPMTSRNTRVGIECK